MGWRCCLHGMEVLLAWDGGVACMGWRFCLHGMEVLLAWDGGVACMVGTRATQHVVQCCIRCVSDTELTASMICRAYSVVKQAVNTCGQTGCIRVSWCWLKESVSLGRAAWQGHPRSWAVHGRLYVLCEICSFDGVV
jgi:hypothetical protein